MRKMGLQSVSVYSKRDHQKRQRLLKKQNLLQWQFKADEPNRVWVSDITCFKVDGKYLYVCLILDLFSQKVDARRGSVQEQYLSRHFHLPSGISEQKRVPAADVFSDQGSQYTSNAFRKLLRMNKVVQSFSESGRPHSTLNYKTPNGFELRHAQRKDMAG